MIFLYFDPGLGALIIQAVVAAVAGFILFSKNLMYKIRIFFGFTKANEDDLFDNIEIKEDIENKNSSDRLQ
jgi:hypothetical protein